AIMVRHETHPLSLSLCLFSGSVLDWAGAHCHLAYLWRCHSVTHQSLPLLHSLRGLVKAANNFRALLCSESLMH
ncbi:hypothetical protein, partial [Bifidobacterium choladohabitans]|uniref:hypothetical protein n=1 Tax=Bifidobacterium choladohabitans TaxID=2750947 RepID=UPI001E5A3420